LCAWICLSHAHNYLFVNAATAAAQAIADGDWIWVESRWGRVRCMCRFSEAVEPGTVWTWNAIGKAPGAWALAPQANESRLGFLLNHLIKEDFSDPVTGQAGWFDVRVRIYPAGKEGERRVSPEFSPLSPYPGMKVTA
jgi:anaerobic selenocysteine-containing dehydrogenase